MVPEDKTRQDHTTEDSGFKESNIGMCKPMRFPIGVLAEGSVLPEARAFEKGAEGV